MPLPKEYGKASETIVLGNLRKTFRKDDIDDIMVFKIDGEITEGKKKYKSILVDKGGNYNLANIFQNVRYILREKEVRNISCYVVPYSCLQFSTRFALRFLWKKLSQDNAFDLDSFNRNLDQKVEKDT